VPCPRLPAHNVTLSPLLRFGLQEDAVAFVQQWLGEVPDKAAALVQSVSISTGTIGVPSGHVEVDLDFDTLTEFEAFRAAASVPSFFRRGDRAVLAEVRTVARSATLAGTRCIPVLVPHSCARACDAAPGVPGRGPHVQQA
jgi:hypothetical protein